jgi:hypothetical protein
MSWVRFRKGLIKVWGSDKVFFHFFENIFEQANEGICRAQSPFFCLFIGFRCGRLEKNSEIFFGRVLVLRPTRAPLQRFVVAAGVSPALSGTRAPDGFQKDDGEQRRDKRAGENVIAALCQHRRFSPMKFATVADRRYKSQNLPNVHRSD